MEWLHGDPVIDSKDDDLGEILDKLGYEPDEVFALMCKDAAGWSFTIHENEDHNEIASSMSIFETSDQTWAYLNQWIGKKDIQ